MFHLKTKFQKKHQPQQLVLKKQPLKVGNYKWHKCQLGMCDWSAPQSKNVEAAPQTYAFMKKICPHSLAAYVSTYASMKLHTIVFKILTFCLRLGIRPRPRWRSFPAPLVSWRGGPLPITHPNYHVFGDSFYFAPHSHLQNSAPVTSDVLV